MEMSFQEKSAWGSLVGLGLVSYWYFPRAFDVAERSNSPAALFGISIACIIALIVILAVYHSAIAMRGGDDTDERDRLIDLRAERISSYALGIGLFWLVGRIVASEQVDQWAQIERFDQLQPMGSLLIAVWILYALVASEVIKNIAQIIYYRIDA
jgi:hypothetical protein